MTEPNPDRAQRTSPHRVLGQNEAFQRRRMILAERIECDLGGVRSPIGGRGIRSHNLPANLQWPSGKENRQTNPLSDRQHRRTGTERRRQEPRGQHGGVPVRPVGFERAGPLPPAGVVVADTSGWPGVLAGGSDGGLGISPYAVGTGAGSFALSDTVSLVFSASADLEGGMALVLRAGGKPQILSRLLEPPPSGTNAPMSTPRPPVTIRFSQYRGPGKITFDKPRPAVEKIAGAAPFNGRASTTAKFSEAGDYVIHVTANDYSGDGGGGFGCCWTTGLVKVSVKP